MGYIFFIIKIFCVWIFHGEGLFAKSHYCLKHLLLLFFSPKSSLKLANKVLSNDFYCGKEIGICSVAPSLYYCNRSHWWRHHNIINNCHKKQISLCKIIYSNLIVISLFSRSPALQLQTEKIYNLFWEDLTKPINYYKILVLYVIKVTFKS